MFEACRSMCLLLLVLPHAFAQWCYQQSTSMGFNVSTLGNFSAGLIPPYDMSPSKLVSSSGGTDYYKFLLNGYGGIFTVYSVSDTGGVITRIGMVGTNPCPSTGNRCFTI